MERFYIITNEGKDHNLTVTKTIQHFILANGRSCEISSLNEQGHLLRNHIPQDIDCALVIGGDGTLIRAARELAHKEVPLLGINRGTLGYLTEVDVHDFQSALKKVFNGEYQIEERMMIEGQVSNNGGATHTALNDIVVARDGYQRIVYYDLFVNEVLLNSYSADGIIVSTPTGSTGYNLSAGGPIVQPTANVIVVTPICAHALNSSSVVLSPEDTITIRIKADRFGQTGHGAVSFDGAELLPLSTGDSVSICMSAEKTKILKINQESFMNTIRNKMKSS